LTRRVGAIGSQGGGSTFFVVEGGAPRRTKSTETGGERVRVLLKRGGGRRSVTAKIVSKVGGKLNERALRGKGTTCDLKRTALRTQKNNTIYSHEREKQKKKQTKKKRSQGRSKPERRSFDRGEEEKGTGTFERRGLHPSRGKKVNRWKKRADDRIRLRGKAGFLDGVGK